MPDGDEGQGTEGQGSTSAGAGGQDPPDDSQAGASGGGDQGQQTRTYDEAYVKKLRDEAAANRKAAKDNADKLKKLEDSKLSDDEKLKKELEGFRGLVPTLQGQLREMQVREAAATHGAVYPKVIAPLIPSDLDFNDDAAVKAAFEGLRQEYPTLFRRTRGGNGTGQDQVPGSGDGGAGTGRTPAGGMNEFIRRAAGRQ